MKYDQRKEIRKMSHIPALLSIGLCSSLATLYLAPAPDPLLLILTFAIVCIPQVVVYFWGYQRGKKAM
jgi:hypothetical protein